MNLTLISLEQFYIQTETNMKKSPFLPKRKHLKVGTSRKEKNVKRRKQNLKMAGSSALRLLLGTANVDYHFHRQPNQSHRSIICLSSAKFVHQMALYIPKSEKKNNQINLEKSSCCTYFNFTAFPFMMSVILSRYSKTFKTKSTPSLEIEADPATR